MPDQERAGVVAAMERERDVFRATFEQRGRDISLELMVLHPMDWEKAEHLAEIFAGRANWVVQPYAEVQGGEDGVRSDLPAGVPVLGAGVLHERRLHGRRNTGAGGVHHLGVEPVAGRAEGERRGDHRQSGGGGALPR